MLQPTIEQLAYAVEKDPVEEWYRRDELQKKFVGLKPSTLTVYINEMDEYPEFSQGILRPTTNVTYIHKRLFLAYLRWKDDNKFKRNKSDPGNYLKGLNDEKWLL
ncbi:MULTISPECIES: hypothetical protein [Ligilactobacillus]|uniref:Uncharacterized protein n=1 Tax=Ligilactobacillus animalis TaxID=1605 RepID=A0ABR4RPY1_9LACO|nr:hypothetical protein [Ligilactobacillus animalis]KDA46148.1 hypothetical protein Lani381_0832 [Ligilactobacillus animalis]MEE0261062.1 hypothetical protein [Ligilactobacillus animalis]